MVRRLIEPLASRVVLAHPKKLRVIAESAKKSDKLDAQTLAEFLALDMIPPSWRPTPRVREHRTLVRLRYYTQRRITATKNKLRRVLADYNADIRPLFTQKGRRYLEQLDLSDADRFHCELLFEELDRQLEPAHSALTTSWMTSPWPARSPSERPGGILEPFPASGR